MFEFEEAVNYHDDDGGSCDINTDSEIRDGISDSDLSLLMRKQEKRTIDRKADDENEEFNFNVKIITDRETGYRYNVPYNRIIKKRYEKLKRNIDDEIENLKDQRARYRMENLNEDQRVIFDYVIKNQQNITVLQAGPGTGKTFTMLTVAHYLAAEKKIANLVIYKHDLVDMYRLSTYGYTVAQFMMMLLRINFSEYVALERQLNANMSVERFMNIIVNFIRRCGKVNEQFTDRLLILDEYTVISKPLLFVLMMVLRRYNIGAVICGDRNQLQNIHNSTHSGKCSAFDIVSSFSHKVFNLSKNERCKDTQYNEIVNFIGKYASTETLDAWGYALVAAIFYKNIVRVPNVNDTILAKEHNMLTDLMDKLVKEYKIPTHPWIIESDLDPQLIQGRRLSNTGKEYIPYPMERYMTAVSILSSVTDNTLSQSNIAELMKHCPGKYLVYLPIIKNNVYFLNDFSERSLCRVLDYAIQDNTVQSVRVLRLNDGREEIVRPVKCNTVMFEKHLSFLLNDGNDTALSHHGNLINFPLYPAFSMSIYMSQGRTIGNNVSFILTRATYECLYVTVSRVTSFKNINAVHIPRNIQYLVSTILNFDLLENRELNVRTLIDKFASSENYIYYEIPLSATDIQHAALGVITGDTKEQRTTAYRILCDLVNKQRPRSTVITPKPLIGIGNGDCVKREVESFHETMSVMLKYKNTIMALSVLDQIDSCAWIHEFLRANVRKFITSHKNLVFAKEEGSVDATRSVNRIANLTDYNTIVSSKEEYANNVATCYSRHEYETSDDKLRRLDANDNDASVSMRCVSEFVYDLTATGELLSNDRLFQMLRERLWFVHDRNETAEKHKAFGGSITIEVGGGSIKNEGNRKKPSEDVAQSVTTDDLLKRLVKANRLRMTKVRRLIKKK